LFGDLRTVPAAADPTAWAPRAVACALRLAPSTLVLTAVRPAVFAVLAQPVQSEINAAPAAAANITIQPEYILFFVTFILLNETL